MSFTSLALIKVTFQGGVTTGSLSVPGVKAGDIILRITNPGENVVSGYFESIVSVDDEIQQQNSNDFSSLTLTAVLVR